MSSKFEFDKTRKAIDTENISDMERKEMLSRFKAGGGEVLNERALKKSKEDSVAPSRSKQSQTYTTQMNTVLPSEMAREKRRREVDKSDQIKKKKEKYRKKIGSPINRLLIRLKTKVLGLSPFREDEITVKTMKFFALEFKQSLIQFNLIINDLFFQNSAIRLKIIRELDSEQPLLTESIERAHKLYDQKEMDDLLDFYSSDPEINTPLEKVSPSIKTIYRDLYYLYPFQETLKKAITRAIEVYNRESSSTPEIKSSLEKKHKEFIRAIKIIFREAFPKMFQLICRADYQDYPPFSSYFEKEMMIDPQMKLGKRISGEKFGETNLESHYTEEEEETEKVDSELEDKKDEKSEVNSKVQSTKEYEYGLKLMKLNTPPSLEEKYKKLHKVDTLEFNDKVFLSILFFLEFDHEYSFVLTTNQIQLTPDYSSGTKIDFKRNLAKIYDDAREIMKAYQRYQDGQREYISIKSRKSTNYIEQSKLETKAEGRVNAEARNVRDFIKTYMEKVTKGLAELINDMKLEKKIVANPEDVVRLDTTDQKDQRLNGKTVQQCILESYCFAVAFRERLEVGDLFGGIIYLNDEEMLESFGEVFKREL